MAGLPFSIKPKALLAASAPQVLEVKPEERAKDTVDQKQQAPWQSYKFGDDIEIKIRKHLTPTQKQQLALTAQLLQSILV